MNTGVNNALLIVPYGIETGITVYSESVSN